MAKIGRHELNFKWNVLISAVEKLPDFDPAWPLQEQEMWYKAHRQGVEAGIALARAEDDLENEQRWWPKAKETDDAPKTE